MPARDHYERYFTEKLWSLIPEVYRDEDGLAINPDVVRSVIEILAAQTSVLRRSHDRLWDDQFVELCDDWAVPYIGGLVGTRLVSALNRRGRRVDVAKTIYYRRRKGTKRVLEELISDIAGWDGAVIEMFRRLGRMRHGLDPKPSVIPPHLAQPGWAELRNPRLKDLADGPFDTLAHTPDMRRQRGRDGRYNIPKLGIHLYRLRAHSITGVDPVPGPVAASFTADPSGRDVPLFIPRDRADDWEQWTSAREWQLPSPMRCRLLNDAQYLIDERLISQLAATFALPAASVADLRSIRNIRFATEERLRNTIASFAAPAPLQVPAVFRALLAGALVADCGKFNLLPEAFGAESAPGAEIARERVAGGNLSNWTGASPDKQVIVDPERGRLLFMGGPAPGSTVRYWYGSLAEIGAGTYDRRESVMAPTIALISGGGAIAAAGIDSNGVTQIDDSRSYGPIADVAAIATMVIQAANQQRPYVRLAADWVLDTGANVESTLVLDGLWIGGSGAFAIVLDGDYERVTIRHSTLDPGGLDAQGAAIAPVDIVVRGDVEEIVIEQSIVAAIRIDGGGLLTRLIIRDAIVQSTASAMLLPLASTELRLERVTVLGGVDVNRLYSTETLVTGLVDVSNTQDGCFRFSAALPGSRVPHPYESHFLPDTNHFFVSRTFGQPGYAQLSDAAPVALREGAENGSEIGAYCGLRQPIRLHGLEAKVEEFAPFGLIPAFVFET